MATETRQLNVNPIDWDTYDTSTVIDSGVMFWFENNDEIGADRRFALIGDGTTTAANLPILAYLEAGAEYTLTTTSSTLTQPEILAYKYSDDVIRVSVIWPTIPKQGTGLTIQLPSSTTIFDATGTTVSLTSAHSVSNVLFAEKRVMFQVTEVGKFFPLVDDAPLFFRWATNTDDGKFTIT